MVDIDFAARYPFTKEAKEAIADIEITETIADKAINLLLESLSGGIKERACADEIEKKEAIAVYAFARMLLGAMRNRYLAGRFAVAVSKLARKNINRETKEAITALLTGFGIRTERGSVYLPDYVRFTPHDRHYALINREVRDGWVKTTEEEKKRMLEEAVRKHVEQVPFLKNPPPAIKKAIEELEKQMPKFEEKKVAKVMPSDYPPCISHLVDELKKHHNLTHHARWLLAVYLINVGLNDDEIVSLYSNLPDFSEKVTRYQVAHARKRGYKVPACASVASFGLCRAACGIVSPLAWVRGGKKK